jgi:polyisoprenoid-binding protein YceI
MIHFKDLNFGDWEQTNFRSVKTKRAVGEFKDKTQWCVIKKKKISNSIKQQSVYLVDITTKNDLYLDHLKTSDKNEVEKFLQQHYRKSQVCLLLLKTVSHTKISY